jgi:hypothetical protein
LRDDVRDAQTQRAVVLPRRLTGLLGERLAMTVSQIIMVFLAGCGGARHDATMNKHRC